MKRPFRSFRYAAFTLVELMVVLGMIAILIGVSLGPLNTALKAAYRTKAGNMANQIQGACMNYYTEYGAYPVPSTFTAATDIKITDASTDATPWSNLSYALCGNVNPYTGLAASSLTVSNTRSIAFLSLKTSDVTSASTADGGTSGIPKNPMQPASTNRYFNVAMDGDYDGILGVGSSAITMPNFAAATTSLSLTGGSTTTGVAVWENCNPSTSTTNPGFWVHTY